MLYEYSCTIRSITDGDGLRVDIDLGFGVTLRGDSGRGVNIRLFGIDAPESRTRNKKEKLHGLLAKNASRRNAKLEARTSLERRRKENLVDGWEISKRQRDGLRKSFSKQSWLSRMKDRIKKQLRRLTKRTDKS